MRIMRYFPFDLMRVFSRIAFPRCTNVAHLQALVEELEGYIENLQVKADTEKNRADMYWAQIGRAHV